MCLKNWNNREVIYGMFVGFLAGIGVSALIYFGHAFLVASP